MTSTVRWSKGDMSFRSMSSVVCMAVGLSSIRNPDNVMPAVAQGMFIFLLVLSSCCKVPPTKNFPLEKY